MPRLPNFLIHLSAFVRPHLLRPDIRVPHIGYVDYPALRREGFNAVVVDKDNCVTLPNVDQVYPPYQPGWDALLKAFPPGRVLVVSNSAGTPKDPSGIAAEAVSLNLQAPVLVRETPKPGCASEILAYFQGQLGRPTTLRGRIHAQTERLMEVEHQDEKEMLKRWIDQADHGPLLEPARSVTSSSEQLRQKAVEKETETASREDIETTSHEETDSTGPLRILVIGDRLFTDTLLAHRLSRLLPRQPSPSVLSIHTTLLPQPNDVRFLRWVEDKLSKGRLREGPVDWSRYVRNPYAGVPTLTEIEAVPRVTFKDKLRDLREDVRESKLQWDPRTWTAFDLAVGVGRGLYWVESRSWRLLKSGGVWLWAKLSGLVHRARQGASKVEGAKVVDASGDLQVGELASSASPASSGKPSSSKPVAA